MPGRPFTPEEFRSALGRFASGVTVITVARQDGQAQGRVHGMTANAFSSVSLEPPLVLVCVNKSAQTCALLAARGRFGINILRQEQEALSRYFAEVNQDPETAERLGIRWRFTERGTPLLEGCLAQLECALAATHEGGDHLIFVGAVEQFAAADGHPLLFYRSRYAALVNSA